MADRSNPAAELADLAGELRRHLRWAQGLGETHLPLAGPHSSELPAPRVAAHPAESAPAGPVAPVHARQPGAAGLAQLRQDLGSCQRCPLGAGRKSLVFGAGNPDADLVFVGDAPGNEEDICGEPFADEAGQLLSKMIEAMGLSREQVYLCTLVRCRPADDRKPTPAELATCAPFLDRQLDALQPRVIVALGQFAAQALLRDPTPITRLRGRWHEYRGIPLLATFHPAYLLRRPGEKANAWQDLKLAMGRLGIAPPQRG